MQVPSNICIGHDYGCGLDADYDGNLNYDWGRTWNHVDSDDDDDDDDDDG